MRKFILSSLELLSQIAIFLILTIGLINGAIGGGVSGGTVGAIVGGIIGFLIALVACVVFFGVIYLLMEIADNTRQTAVSIRALQARQKN